MSNEITKFDPNFRVNAVANKDGMAFYNIESAPFRVSGVKLLDGRYRRMPEEVAKTVSEGIHGGHSGTAGGCVCFRTDSAKIAISAKIAPGKMPHFAFTGSAGFDLYIDDVFTKAYVPPYQVEDGYEGTAELGKRQWRNVTINFPTYSWVYELNIGIEEDASLEAPKPYAYDKPIVYYGSSITQGGCSSRPGMTYEAIITRRFNVEHINLGFSGCAKGETAMAEYISSLDMLAFVYDYDHNAPNADHLKATHEPMFKIIRAANPDLPIIFLTAPIFYPNQNWSERTEIIRTTYQNAMDAGDKNVYFIDGPTLMALAQNEGTVDNCHPNDLGFASMAKAVGDVLETILK